MGQLGIGLGVGLEPSRGGVGGGSQGSPILNLTGYYAGIDGSSFVADSFTLLSTISTGTHGIVTAADLPTNLAAAAGSTFSWDWINGGDTTRPIYHDGDWTNLNPTPWGTTTVTAPNGQPYFGGNWGTPDSSLSLVSQFGVRSSTLKDLTVGSAMFVCYWMGGAAGQLFRPLYTGDGVNRIEITSNATGRVLVRTDTYGPTNVVDMGDLRTDSWLIWGYSWGGDSLRMWLNGAWQTLSSQPTGGGIGHTDIYPGSMPYGAYAAVHLFESALSNDDMNEGMSYLADQYGIAYTFTTS